MLAATRKQLLLDRLRSDGRIVAKELAAELGLSEDSIRRDLRELDAAGLAVRVYGGALPASPAVADYGLTPGDIGEVFGEIGRHFRSLAIAYIEQPRLSFYAMRMDGPIATTADLQPHLAEIGRYVGIAGLDPDPWSLAVVADRDWFHPPAGRFFRWYTTPPVTICMPIGDAPGFRQGVFHRIQDVLRSGGFVTHDLG